MRKVRRTRKLGQDRVITLLDKQGREIPDQNKIMEKIEEFYTELINSEQSTIINKILKRYSRDNTVAGGSSTTSYEKMRQQQATII